MSNLQYILQQIFRKDSLVEVPVTQLEQLVEEHPLFASAQYLLASKYRDTGNELYKKQLEKTALHFQNPLWLHYHLAEKATSTYVEENRSDNTTTGYTVTDVEPVLSHDRLEEVVTHQEIIPNEPLADNSREQVNASENPYTTDDAHIGQLYVTNEASEASKEADEESANAHTIQAENLTAEKPSVSAHPIFSKSAEDNIDESKPAFEPFHTVDYFASQGIKVSQDIKPDDRLGKQLKSFTEWLRTMRKLPEAFVEEELEKLNDREIVTIAEHSLQENDVVTEAMAEVFFKQGRHQEAADVYHKLSLLNPAKSSYFAAKIEALKNH